MLSQRFAVASGDAPPPYTEERAPPSYTEGEAEEDLQAQPTHPISAPAPAALDVTARIRHIAPPVLTPHNAFDTRNRTPFKYPTRPGRGYTRTAVSHTYVDMPEPILATEPMRYEQTDVSTTASRTSQRGRVRGWSSCIAFMLMVALIVVGIYLVWKNA